MKLLQVMNNILYILLSHSEPINKILSANMFQVLSKLTYGAYLMHPLVYYLVITSNETTLHITVFLFVVLYIGTFKFCNFNTC